MKLSSATKILASLIILTGLGAGYAGGDGSSSNPYEISDCIELQNIQNSSGSLNDNYELISDIDCSGTKNWNGGNGFSPIGPENGNEFGGELDGNGHAITNLYINRTSSSYNGLFGDIQYATVKNLSMESIEIIGGSYYTGGLSGSTDSSTIERVDVEGFVKGEDRVGILLGSNYQTQVRHSYTEGSAEATGATVGGLIGWNNNGGIVNRSFSTANLSGTLAGGLVAKNADNGKITTSFASGNVTSDSTAGSLVGNNDGTIKKSVGTGHVTGSPAGGLTGDSYSDTVENSYWDINTTGQDTSSSSGTGLLKSEITVNKAEENLQQFNFQTTWKACKGVNKGHPVLRVTGNFNCPPSATIQNPVNKNLNPSSGATLEIETSDIEGDKHNVTFYTDSDNEISSLEEVSSGSQSTTWNGISVDNTYNWYVEKKDNFGYTQTSTQSFTTIGVTLNWNDNSNNEDGFHIYSKASGDMKRVKSVTENTESTTVYNPGLEFNKNTTYEVTAYNQYGESSRITGYVKP